MQLPCLNIKNLRVHRFEIAYQSSTKQPRNSSFDRNRHYLWTELSSMLIILDPWWHYPGSNLDVFYIMMKNDGEHPFSAPDGTLFNRHEQSGWKPKTKPTRHWEVAARFRLCCSARASAITGPDWDWQKDRGEEHVLFLSFLFLLMIINACFCSKPSWTPKLKQNGHFSMAGWSRFWCSTRLLSSCYAYNLFLA